MTEPVDASVLKWEHHLLEDSGKILSEGYWIEPITGTKTLKRRYTNTVDEFGRVLFSQVEFWNEVVKPWREARAAGAEIFPFDAQKGKRG